MDNRRGKWHLVAFIACAISVIYTFLIPDPIGKDTLIQPLPEIKILGEPEASLPSNIGDHDSRAFMGKNFIGYYSAKGDLIALMRRDSGAILGDDFAIFRTGKAKVYSYFDLKTKANRIIGEEGFPLTIDGNPFVMRNDQMGISKLGNEGAVLWRYEFGRIITGASAVAERAAFGTLSGEAIVLDKDGLPLFIIEPSVLGLSAKYPCVYGIALSPDGSMLAMLHGLEPQRLSIFKERGSGWGVLASILIEKESPYPRESAFSMDGSQGFFDSGDGYFHFDAEEKEFRHLPLKLETSSDRRSLISPLGEDGFTLLYDAGGSTNFGLIINGVLRASFNVAAGASLINVRGTEVDVIGDAAIQRFFVDLGGVK
ncbi:MAG: hypothetical protein FD137_2219 [Spirochaetes bacterium]|nr:MAG: hypothetical protein FD137_2219 [Spirochaetota bacterium]